MNTDIIKGKWHIAKGDAKVQWGRLTDDDLEQVEGHVEKLIGTLQARYGYTRDRAKAEVDAFFDRY